MILGLVEAYFKQLEAEQVPPAELTVTDVPVLSV